MLFLRACDMPRLFHWMQEAVGDGNCAGWAAHDESGKLSPIKFTRRDPRPDDVVIQITYCGMCHSDLHQIKNEWQNSTYPMIPGHEMIGVVVGKGDAVTRFEIGDIAGVGCMIDSCGNCGFCKQGEEQYCANVALTYNGKCAPTLTPHFNIYSYEVPKVTFYMLAITT
jgi:alcohol dehydrogenase (NADP+)